MRDEEIRVLWRAYVALTLAHEAARQCATTAAPDPCLSAVINNQELAIGEMDGLLGRVFAASVEEPSLPDAEVNYVALLM